MAEFWRNYSAYTSGYQSVDKLSDIDEFEESFKYLSVVDKTKHYYTLCRAATPLDTPQDTPQDTPHMSPKKDGVKGEDEESKDEGFGAEAKVINDVKPEDVDDKPDVDDQDVKLEDENDLADVENDTLEVEIEINEFEDEVSEEIYENGKKSENENKISETETPQNQNKIPETEQQNIEIKIPESEQPNTENKTTETEKPNTENKTPETEKPKPKPTKPKTDDHHLTSDTPNTEGLHYRAGDEPEPIELTHLNVEAAMMCLASKVRALCGKADSPTLSSRTFRFKELENNKIKKSASHDSAFKIPDVPNPNREMAECADWASELRPSMRKLRQGMDSLCKTARLVCSVIRLQQRMEAVNLSRDIRSVHCFMLFWHFL